MADQLEARGSEPQGALQPRLLAGRPRLLRARPRRREAQGRFPDVEHRPSAVERHRRRGQGRELRAPSDGRRACSPAGASGRWLSGEGAYNPIGYHVGTVWPHDNSIIAMGLRTLRLSRRGRAHDSGDDRSGRDSSTRACRRRSPATRESYAYPAEYPTACSPQAWATGTPLLLLRALLGLEPEGAQLSIDPVLPSVVSQIDLTGIPGRWGRIDVSADAPATLLGALESAAGEAPTAVREYRHPGQGADACCRAGSGVSASLASDL